MISFTHLLNRKERKELIDYNKANPVEIQESKLPDNLKRMIIKYKITDLLMSLIKQFLIFLNGSFAFMNTIIAINSIEEGDNIVALIAFLVVAINICAVAILLIAE